MLGIGMGFQKVHAFEFSQFLPSSFWKKYVIKQWLLFTFRQTAPSSKAFGAFMYQTPSNMQKLFTYRKSSNNSPGSYLPTNLGGGLFERGGLLI